MNSESPRPKSRKLIYVGGFAAVVAVWWLATTPPAYIEIAPPYRTLKPDGPPQLHAWMRAGKDFAAGSTKSFRSRLPGYDELVILPGERQGLAMGMDGWIWKVRLSDGHATRLADPPLNPAGARLDPSNPNRVYFCAARLYGAKYSTDERPGVYSINVRTGLVRPVLLAVPTTPKRKQALAGMEGTLFPDRAFAYATPTGPRQDALRAGARQWRSVAFCNDLDVSRDGSRIYFTEPFAYKNASMGGGAFREAISLGRNGRLWRVDLKRKQVQLIAQNYTFIDGVLLEYGAGPVEQSVLISETVNFRILRFHLNGKRAGRDQVLWESLPGLPDGLDRDAQGRIWIGLVKDRSPLVTWVHRTGWLKPLLLRLPHRLLPVPKKTGLMALSPDASRVVFYSMHDGSRLHDISVVVPGKKHLYPAVFRLEQRGFHRLPYPSFSAPGP